MIRSKLKNIKRDYRDLEVGMIVKLRPKWYKKPIIVMVLEKTIHHLRVKRLDGKAENHYGNRKYDKANMLHIRKWEIHNIIFLEKSERKRMKRQLAYEGL